MERRTIRVSLAFLARVVVVRRMPLAREVGRRIRSSGVRGREGRVISGSGSDR
jgi:hypothetical protein